MEVSLLERLLQEKYAAKEQASLVRFGADGHVTFGAGSFGSEAEPEDRQHRLAKAERS